jgi:isopropylmalate/homocitrate/citramalate synthase
MEDGNRLVFLTRAVSRISDERINEALDCVLDEAVAQGIHNAEVLVNAEDANHYTLQLYGEDAEGVVRKHRSVGLRHNDLHDRPGSVKRYAETLASVLAVDLGIVVKH